jgi:hypothetical protein
MPLGASRLNFLAKALAEAAAAQRDPNTITANGNVHVSRNENQFGGSSANFDGTGDYLEVDTDEVGNFDFAQNDFTVEMWFRLDTVSAGRRTLIAGKNQTGSIELEVDGATPKLARTNVAFDITSSSTVSANTWYHIAIVRSGDTKTMYLDGSSVGTKDVTGINEKFSDYFNIGAYIRGFYFWDGYIDEVRISDNARYTTTFTPSTTAFVNDENTLFLMHANGYGATSNDNFWDDNGNRAPIEFDYHGATPGTIDTAQKQFGTASWNSTQDYDMLTCAKVDDRLDGIGANDAFTIECWVRRSGANPDSNVCHIWDGGNQNRLYYDETSSAVIWDTEGTARITGGDLSLNTWYHIAVVRDTSNNTKLYIDGTQSGSTFTSDDRNFANITAIGIGGSTGGSDAFIGHIDEFRLSDNQRYTTGFTSPTSAFENDENTLMLHHFDGADGSNDIRDDNGRT